MMTNNYIMDKLSVLFVCECVCLSSPLAPSVLHGRGPRPLRVTPQALGIRPTFPHSAACWGGGGGELQANSPAQTLLVT